jgi:L-lactate dehydrogenase complex protein LldG
MSAREGILAAIRTSGSAAAPAPLRRYQQEDLLTPAEVQARFTARVTDYGVVVTPVPDEAAIAGAVAAICAARGIASLAVSPDCPLSWRPGNVAVIEDHPLPIEQLAAIPAALTAAAVAIAETGTVVLDGGPAQGRRAITLLPDFHICVVFATQIVECVPTAIRCLAPAARLGRPFTFISGPSATADIEFDRVQGVHGPRQLDLILVREGRN